MQVNPHATMEQNQNASRLKLQCKYASEKKFSFFFFGGGGGGQMIIKYHDASQRSQH